LEIVYIFVSVELVDLQTKAILWISIFPNFVPESISRGVGLLCEVQFT